MEKNGLLFSTDWDLVEEFAKKIYKNDMAVLTKSDVKEIEKAIEDGIIVYDNKNETGEMNFLTGSVVSVVTIGFMAIQTVLSYVTWRYPKKTNTTISDHFESIKEPKKVSDYIDMIIKQYGDKLKPEIRNELLKNKEVFNNLLSDLIATINLSKTTE